MVCRRAPLAASAARLLCKLLDANPDHVYPFLKEPTDPGIVPLSTCPSLRELSAACVNAFWLALRTATPGHVQLVIWITGCLVRPGSSAPE